MSSKKKPIAASLSLAVHGQRHSGASSGQLIVRVDAHAHQELAPPLHGHAAEVLHGGLNVLLLNVPHKVAGKRLKEDSSMLFLPSYTEGKLLSRAQSRLPPPAGA